MYLDNRKPRELCRVSVDAVQNDAEGTILSRRFDPEGSPVLS